MASLLRQRIRERPSRLDGPSFVEMPFARAWDRNSQATLEALENALGWSVTWRWDASVGARQRSRNTSPRDRLMGGPVQAGHGESTRARRVAPELRKWPTWRLAPGGTHRLLRARGNAAQRARGARSGR